MVGVVFDLIFGFIIGLLFDKEMMNMLGAVSKIMDYVGMILIIVGGGFGVVVKVLVVLI